MSLIEALMILVCLRYEKEIGEKKLVVWKGWKFFLVLLWSMSLEMFCRVDK